MKSLYTKILNSLNPIQKSDVNIPLPILITFFLLVCQLLVLATTAIYSLIGLPAEGQLREVAERNLYLLFAIICWPTGVYLHKLTKSMFVNFSEEGKNILPWIVNIYLNLSIFTAYTQTSHDMPRLGVVIFLLTNQILIYFLLKKGITIPVFIRVIVVTVSLLTSIYLLYFFDKLNFDFQFPKELQEFKFLLTSVLLFVPAYFLSDRILNKITPLRKLVFLLFPIVIILITYIPTFPHDPGHHSYFLGPILKISNGGTMLVDTFSQYGVSLFYAVYYFLKFAGLGFSFEGLSLLSYLLSVSSYIAFFLLSYYSFRKSLFSSILATSIMILLNFYTGFGVPAQFPSTGALRFGIVYLLSGLFILKWEFLRGTKARNLMAILLGLSATWSFDAFTNTFYVFTAIHIIYFIEASKISYSKALKGLFAGFVLGIFSVFSFIAILTLFTFIKSGSFPNFTPYLMLVNAYASGFGLIQIPPVGMWWIFFGLYLFSAIWGLNKLKIDKFSRNSSLIRTVLIVSAVGISIFPYYVGRSHTNNIFHVLIPAVFLASFWVWYLSIQKVPFFIRYFGLFLLFSLFIYAIKININPVTTEKYNSTLLGLTINFWPEPPFTEVKNAAEESIRKDREYWISQVKVFNNINIPKTSRLASLLRGARATGPLVKIQKGNFVTLAEPEQDGIIWDDISHIIFNQVHNMREEDLLVSYESECSLFPEIRSLFYEFDKLYVFNELARQDGIVVWQIVSKKDEGDQDTTILSKAPILTSVSAPTNKLTITDDIKSYIPIYLTGDNLKPTTTAKIGMSTFKIEQVESGHLKINVPHYLFYTHKQDSYEIFLSDCSGNSNKLIFALNL